MNTTADRLDSVTGWTGTLAVAANQVPDVIAGGNAASLMFTANASLNATSTKTVSVNLSAYNTLVLYTKSLYMGADQYLKPSDFKYKIDFGFAEYYLPAGGLFQPIHIAIPASSTITRIKVTCLHNGSDVLVISNLVAYKDEIPADILDGFNTGIAAEITTEFGNGLSLGTFTGSVGDTSITVSSGAFSWRFAEVFITDGVNSETHIIEDQFASKLTFSKQLDGKALLHNYSGANAYIKIPAKIGSTSEAAIVPAVTTWGFVSDRVKYVSQEDTQIDTFNTAGTAMVRKDGVDVTWMVLIDIESIYDEIIERISVCVKKFLSKNAVWINGVKYEIRFDITPQYVENTVQGQIPKIQYTCYVTLMEDVWQRNQITFPQFGTLTITGTPYQNSLP